MSESSRVNSLHQVFSLFPEEVSVPPMFLSLRRRGNVKRYFLDDFFLKATYLLVWNFFIENFIRVPNELWSYLFFPPTLTNLLPTSYLQHPSQRHVPLFLYFQSPTESISTTHVYMGVGSFTRAAATSQWLDPWRKCVFPLPAISC